MAVIQDLPAELLRRILELVEGEWTLESDPVLDMLSRTSLVARAWRHPSQALLFYNMDFNDCSSKLCTERLRSNAGRTLQLVLLGGGISRRTLSTLEENEIAVEALRLFQTWAIEVDMSTISLRLLAGLKSLHIGGNLQGRPKIPSDMGISLSHLSFDTERLQCLPVLDSIVKAAPRLTSFELVFGQDEESLPADYIIQLRPLAQQLRHLTISFPYIYNAYFPRPSLDVSRLVAACTSLKCLELSSCSTSFIAEVIAASTASLLVIETALAWGWNEEGGGVAGLVSVLELPAMRTLRRWRLEKVEARSKLLAKEDIAAWEDACRDRGVEPRDDRRFFTDYPAE